MTYNVSSGTLSLYTAAATFITYVLYWFNSVILGKIVEVQMYVVIDKEQTWPLHTCT